MQKVSNMKGLSIIEVVKINYPMIYMISGSCKLCLFVLSFCFSTKSFSQDKTKKDTTTIETRKISLIYGCQDASDISNFNFRKDSFLYDFFNQIDNNRFFKYDSSAILLKLLDVAEGNSDRACFLPFLRMIDFEADKMYKENCYMTGMQLPFPKYCIEPPIQFLVLFYLQFTIVNTLKLEKGVKISNIYLQNKKKAKNTILTQVDYHNIYYLYRNWIINAKSNRHKVKNPLKHSDYEWVIKYKDYVVIPR